MVDRRASRATSSSRESSAIGRDDVAQGDDGLAGDGRRGVAGRLRQGAHGVGLARARRGRDGVAAQQGVPRVGLEHAPGQAHLEARERVERSNLEERIAGRERRHQRAGRLLAGLLAGERRTAQRLGGCDAHVRVLVGEGVGQGRSAARVGHSGEDLDGQLAGVGVEPRHGLDGRADRVRPDGHQGLDRRVAQPDVEGLLQRGHEGGHDLLAALERGGHRGGLLAHPPVLVAERPQQELGRFVAAHLRDLVHGHTASLGLGLLEQPVYGGRSFAHVDFPEGSAPGRAA